MTAEPIRVLITGIAGQDGGYLAELEAGRGRHVHGVLRPGREPGAHLAALGEALTLHRADTTDGVAMASLLDEVRPHIVYNLAALSSVAASWADPVGCVRTNAETVAALLDHLWAWHSAGEPIRFVQASSAEVFGASSYSPQDETTPMSVRSPYGAAKVQAHLLVELYRARGMHASNAVLFNHESIRRPHAYVTRKITSTVAAIADGRADELVLGNLEARRDWGFAGDYVDAMALMADHPSADSYVVASGVARSVKDLVRTAFSAIGVTNWQRYVRVDPAFVRPSDPHELRGDATRARDVLGWRPKVGFEHMISDMVSHDQRSGSS